MRKPSPFAFLVRLLPHQSIDRMFSGNQERQPERDNLDRTFVPDTQFPTEDSPEAVERLRHAAEYGSAIAQNSVGLMFTSGQGVLRSDAEARRWFRRAAEQGDADAQFNLGNLCHPANLRHLAPEVGEARIEAYVWFHLAAAQGHRKAESSYEMLNLQMTDEELQEGNRRAHAFQVRKEITQESQGTKSTHDPLGN